MVKFDCKKGLINGKPKRAIIIAFPENIFMNFNQKGTQKLFISMIVGKLAYKHAV